MILLDANILVYLHNADAAEHEKTSVWLEEMLADGQSLGLPLPVVWAFLRLVTNQAWAKPIPPPQAFRSLRELVDQSGMAVIKSGPRHLEILERLVTDYKIVGPRISDAVLAAMAIEHGAALASADRDFRRFEELRWINPLAS